MKSARLRPIVDTEPCELPKKNDATPLGSGLGWVAQRRLIIRSAPTVLAVPARSASDGQRVAGRDKNASMPMAVIRPSNGKAKSHRLSDSLIGPAEPDMMLPGSSPPRPGSMMILLPDSRGPERRSEEHTSE